MTTRTIRFSVVAQGVPTWFANQTDKTWVAIASSPGDIVGQPTYSGAYGTDGVGNVTTFSSGTVHERRQSLLLHGGGHTAADNGVYEFSLLDTSNGGYPQWQVFKTRHDRRFPTNYSSITEDQRWNPTYQFDRSVPTANDPYGAPAACHTYNYVTYVPSQDSDPTNDSIWVPVQSAMYANVNAPSWLGSTSADSSVWRLRYDPVYGKQVWTLLQRDYRTTLYPGDTTAQRWQGFGPCLYNSVAAVPHLLRLRSGTGDSARHFTISLTDGSRTLLSTAPLIPALMYESNPARVATGQSFAAWVSIPDQKLYLIDLTNYANPQNNVARSVLSWPTGDWGDNFGMVWHAPSKGFLIWGEKNLATGNLWKLYQPESNWWNGQWQSELIAPVGGATPTAPAVDNQAQTYQRFNIIRNVGGGANDALVLINAVAGPTYVYKLPAGGV